MRGIMAAIPSNKKVIADIAELYGVLGRHVALDETNREKIDAMYKLLITGNGIPALPETVRKHGDWIDAQCEKDKIIDARGYELKKGVIFLAVGQVLTLIAGIAAVIAKK